MDARIARAGESLGWTIMGARPAGSGASGSVLRLDVAGDRRCVAKLSTTADLRIEARGIDLLRERGGLPVPPVHLADEQVLVMDEAEGTHDTGRAERHAAELLTKLHAVTDEQSRFGLDFDNLIGPLPQANGWTTSWVTFFRDRRLLAMAHAAAEQGAISTTLAARIETLAAKLGDLIPDNPPASLIHGDIWSGNVLAAGDRITAFLDPSPCYAHAEVELAFITLFSTFGERFFARYGDLCGGIDREFWTTRRHIYNLYPLLVHARLFGGSYVAQVESVLARFV
jgi:fructosamine-3-kinase